MGVIVIEKIYHHTNSPSLSTPYLENVKNTGSKSWALLALMDAMIMFQVMEI